MLRQPPLVDSLVFHDWPSIEALLPYVSQGFRSWVERPNDTGGVQQLRPQWLYSDPRVGAPRATDIAALTAHLDAEGCERAVLGYEAALLATGYPQPYVAATVATAANCWTVDEWLDKDSRLHGLILVSTSLPSAAAAEITRAGENERMVGVALGTNALNRPFGDPLYHPIYAAASELDLPIVIQVGSDGVATSNAMPTGGGLPTTFAEYRALGSQAHMSHAMSMITSSVFDLFPNLRVMLVGGGITWMPWFVMRFDYWYKMFPTEGPWMRKLPSEYFAEHFRVATFGLEQSTTVERLGRSLSAVSNIEKMLIYTSGFPSLDAEAPDTVAERIPEAWHPGVFGDNALGFFRWPDRPRAQMAPPLLAQAEFGISPMKS
jgi:predicted TIM-barrel fold metal-dependent hydrolase